MLTVSPLGTCGCALSLLRERAASLPLPAARLPAHPAAPPLTLLCRRLCPEFACWERATWQSLPVEREQRGNPEHDGVPRRRWAAALPSAFAQIAGEWRSGPLELAYLERPSGRCAWRGGKSPHTRVASKGRRGIILLF